jgi:Tfp pilus assembly protein FimT
MKITGFTLLELMVTISLAILLLAIGAPSLGYLLNNNSSQLQASMFIKHLVVARQQAIATQQDITTCLITTDSTNKHSCVAANNDQAQRLLAFIDNNNNQQPDNGEVIITMTTAFPANVTILANRPYVKFKSDGTALGTNLTYQLCVSEQLMIDMVVSPSGHIRTEITTQLCPVS